MKIGSAWRTQTRDKQKDYIAIKFDEVVLNAIPQLKDYAFQLWINEITPTTHENAPHYTVVAQLKDNKPKEEDNKPKEEEKQAESPTIPY